MHAAIGVHQSSCVSSKIEKQTEMDAAVRAGIVAMASSSAVVSALEGLQK
jgi:hypothetical protein